MYKIIYLILFFIAFVLTILIYNSFFSGKEIYDNFIIVNFDKHNIDKRDCDKGSFSLTASETWLLLSGNNIPNEEPYKSLISENKSLCETNLLLPFSSIVAGNKEMFVQYDKINNNILDEKLPQPVIYKSTYRKISPTCIQVDMLRQGWTYKNTYYSERIAIFLHFEIIDLLTKIEDETYASVYWCKFISSMNKVETDNLFPGELLYYTYIPYKVKFINKYDSNYIMNENNYKIISSEKEKKTIYNSSIFFMKLEPELYYFYVDD